MEGLALLAERTWLRRCVRGSLARAWQRGIELDVEGGRHVRHCAIARYLVRKHPAVPMVKRMVGLRRSLCKRREHGRDGTTSGGVVDIDGRLAGRA